MHTLLSANSDVDEAERKDRNSHTRAIMVIAISPLIFLSSLVTDRRQRLVTACRGLAFVASLLCSVCMMLITNSC